MRRIYESDALSREEDDHFSPNRKSETERPQAMRSVNGSAWSKRLVPHGLRRRAISVRVSTPSTVFEPEATVPFTVTIKNALPIPITIETQSPVLWTWSVDDLQEASQIDPSEPPDRTGEFHFDRGERVQFRKQWSGLFRVSDREWEPAQPGEYTIGAAINVADPKAAALADETTIEIVDADR